MIESVPNKIVIEKWCESYNGGGPWMWTCNMPSATPGAVFAHSGGIAASWEVAHLAAVTHAAAAHGVRI